MLSTSYLERFQGVGRLYGLAGLEQLSQSRVTIVGLGGVGSWTAEALARTGVGALHLVDLDEVCLTNTNRQIHALEGQYGRPKITALAERLRQINPDIIIKESLRFYSAQSSSTLLSPCPSAVVDAVDSVRAKCHLLAECVRQNIPVVCSGGAGGKSRPSLLEVADLAHTHNDPLLGAVRKILRAEYQFPAGEGKRAAHFGIRTVFSAEPMQPPQPCHDTQDSAEGARRGTNLNCATGYGAVAHLTASFGLFLAGEVIDLLLE